ncbi:MAG: membrane integrity-associated transporter subunit PqiC [Gammaproteobacteria bacterium]|nr:MAG: membrane integrity-associated transporter subunit PqiC [Gammaproteobacteria bacterium]
MRGKSRSAFFVLLAALMITAGCAKGPPPDFYVLHATTSESIAGVEHGIAVGVGPIELPAHLNRSQIVTRTSDYQLDLSESHQWAEPLKDSVSRVIAVNLSNKLKSNRVYVIPRRQKVSLNFQVSIDIARFDGRLGEAATLDARWTLYGKDTREPLLSKVTIVYEKTRDGSYDALVGASSRTLEVLSMEIAEAINARR